mmetsp:Transcript_25693/g.58263  ORF Transcript_25693/g.58263 Transcript_25693/m.58263 type:complete len:200 (-) Transcript_25693:609-1208(-)
MASPRGLPATGSPSRSCMKMALSRMSGWRTSSSWTIWSPRPRCKMRSRRWRNRGLRSPSKQPLRGRLSLRSLRHRSLTSTKRFCSHNCRWRRSPPAPVGQSSQRSPALAAELLSRLKLWRRSPPTTSRTLGPLWRHPSSSSPQQNRVQIRLKWMGWLIWSWKRSERTLRTCGWRFVHWTEATTVTSRELIFSMLWSTSS